MVLSYKLLKNGFEFSIDGQNLGVHEFSHLLDNSDGAFDDVPIYLTKDLYKIWLELFEKEIIKIKRNNLNLTNTEEHQRLIFCCNNGRVS